MYAASGDPNVKRGAQVLNGRRAPLATPLATVLPYG